MKTRLSKLLLILLIAFPAFVFNSCTAVKPFQKMYLNDGEMELSSRKAEKFEQYFQLYREGTSGANGGKSGGGCGCN